MENMKQGMVSIFLSQALRQKKIHVKGSKDRFRDMIYIDDVVEAFKVAFNINTNKFRIYNVCSGVKTSVKKVIQLIQLNLPYKISVIYKGSTQGDIRDIRVLTRSIMKCYGFPRHLSKMD